jgi:hypothetical protein
VAKQHQSREEKAREGLLSEGTVGCVWRYTLISGHVKKTYNEAVEDEKVDYDHLAGLKAILNAVVDVPVVEVPALAYAEAHGHCSEIAHRVFLEDHLLPNIAKRDDLEYAQYQAWVQKTDVAPTLKIQRIREDLETEENVKVLEHQWSVYRQTRDWTYEGEPHVILYDKPIQHVGINDDAVSTIYEMEVAHEFDVYLVGHAISRAGLIAFTMQVHRDPGTARGIGMYPLTEYMTISSVPTQWMFFDSYADDVLQRLCTHKEASDPLNKKLSFKRKVQKVSKLGRGNISRFPVDYRTMHSVGIDLFPDIAIRRGWVCKHHIESDLTDEEESEVERRFRAGTHAVQTWTANDAIEFNIAHGHKAIVERFLATRQHQLALQQEAPEAEFRAHGKEVGALLRQARIIELPWRFYWKQVEKAVLVLHNATLIALGKEKYQSDSWATITQRMRDLKKVDAEAHDECAARVHNAMVKFEWEPEMPFPVCWLGYDIPIGGTIDKADGTKTDFLSQAYGIGANVDVKKDGLPYLYGHLLTKDTVYAFFTLIKTNAKGDYVPTHRCFALVEKETDWNHPNAYSAMVLTATMAFIEDHQIVLEQLSRKRQDRTFKRVNPTLRRNRMKPSPYYTVYIKDGVYDVKKEPVREGTRGPLVYSHDRAGGTYYRIKRGPLPLSKKDRAMLLRPRSDGHGYQIFEDEKPWGEWADAVKKRGARPKAPHEWMAILKWRRRDTVVRPDLPIYIPSVRRSEKHKEKKR